MIGRNLWNGLGMAFALAGAAPALAQDRPMAAGLPSDPKELARMCSAQVMLAAYERSELGAEWPHETAALMAAGKAWMADYAARSGQSPEAALSGDVGTLTETLQKVRSGLRVAPVGWCVRNAPRS